jgi:hypothetical protein
MKVAVAHFKTKDKVIPVVPQDDEGNEDAIKRIAAKHNLNPEDVVDGPPPEEEENANDDSNEDKGDGNPGKKKETKDKGDEDKSTKTIVSQTSEDLTEKAKKTNLPGNPAPSSENLKGTDWASKAESIVSGMNAWSTP